MESIYHDLRPMVMLSVLIYSLIGFIIFLLALFIMDKLAPFSMQKEIEDDQNTALAIIMGSVFIALAIIIQAAMR